MKIPLNNSRVKLAKDWDKIPTIYRGTGIYPWEHHIGCTFLGLGSITVYG